MVQLSLIIINILNSSYIIYNYIEFQKSLAIMQENARLQEMAKQDAIVNFIKLIDSVAEEVDILLANPASDAEDAFFVDLFLVTLLLVSSSILMILLLDVHGIHIKDLAANNFPAYCDRVPYCYLNDGGLNTICQAVVGCFFKDNSSQNYYGANLYYERLLHKQEILSVINPIVELINLS